ncbi:MAG TPA: glycolate oxidase subunit GlcE [Rhizomicrobium sp.]|jgi:glycolate oxidase FAD binding subunit
MTHFTPASIEDLVQIVSSAAENREALEVFGNGTKRDMGRPVQAEHTLTTANLNGISLYEPEELVLSAKAGTPLSQIEALLAENQQQLAFEPPHWGTQTIGGVVAAGLSGPRRIQAGAVRDHLLGFTAVNGRGEIFKSGGRVVKNVTGYDLSKLMAGSFGTLAVLSEVTLKVLPQTQARATLIARGQSPRESIALMCRALGMPFDVTGAAWIPNFDNGPVTALRLEGFAESVADRANSLTRLLGVSVAGVEFDTFWDSVRDVSALDASPVLWRISVPPSFGAEILEAFPQAKGFLDWGGGLVWLAMPEDGDCGTAQLRAVVAKIGGHATLMRASEDMRARLEVFQPQPPALAALTARVKDSFDPLRIFNPGRMYAGV